MVNRLMMWRWKSPSILALAVVSALTILTTEVAARQERHTTQMVARKAGEPIMAIVSIKSQQVTLYDANGWILRAPVSTGTRGRETPTGIFAVLEKKKVHYSDMYDDASMPNMQRITWNGIAMHGGPLPGYAASHGCIRLPYGFAASLFGKTRIGMRVIISPDDAVPIDFAHPALFSPNAEAIEAAPGRVDTFVREAVEAAKAYREAKKTAKSAARMAASQKKSLRKLQWRKKRADAQLRRTDKALSAADKAKVRAEERQRKAVAEAAELAVQLNTAKSDLEAKNANTSTTTSHDAAQSNDEAKKAVITAAREVASRKASLRKLQRAKKRTDAKLGRAVKSLTTTKKAKVQAEERQRKAAIKATELATRLETTKLDLQAKTAAADIAKNAVKAAKTRKAETAKAALDAKLALEPVSVYISRATQRLYVRRNTHKPAPDGGGEVFDSSIEVPVTIRDPDKPIGTHIFTAMDRNDAGLHWTVVTIDNGDDTKAALDRITIPQAVLNRIAPTALPRSSIVISDEPLSKETNYRTEFVAVLSDQPRGGFITRKPSRVRTLKDRGSSVAENNQPRKKKRRRRSFRFPY